MGILMVFFQSFKHVEIIEFFDSFRGWNSVVLWAIKKVGMSHILEGLLSSHVHI